MSVVHPSTVMVAVAEGAFQVRISPWTMAQRAELRPRVLALISKLQATSTSLDDLVAIFGAAEDEVAGIVQATVQIPDGHVWDELLWEDLPVLAQTVWDVCVMRGVDGGLLGKLPRALLTATQQSAATKK